MIIFLLAYRVSILLFQLVVFIFMKVTTIQLIKESGLTGVYIIVILPLYTFIVATGDILTYFVDFMDKISILLDERNKRRKKKEAKK